MLRISTELTYLWTVVVPSRYKLGLILLLLVSSCSKEPKSTIETRGMDIDTTHLYVDAVSIDSMSFASGKKQWLLKGLIVSDGIEYPYSLVYKDNPFTSDSVPIASTPPRCIDSNKDVQVTLTRQARNVMISWKTEDQFLCIKTVITSGH